MKHLGSFLLGIVLLAVGAIIFLQNVNVGSLSLYRYGGVNVGAILIVLIAIAFIVMLVKANVFTVGIFLLLCIAFVITLIMGLNITIARMTGLSLALIIGTLCVGIAFVIKGLFGLANISKEK